MTAADRSGGKPARNRAWWISLVCIAVFVKVIAYFPATVEGWYSTGIYPVISRLLRAALGWIPFSVGDVLYAAALIYAITMIIRGIRTVVRKGVSRAFVKKAFLQVLWFALVIYVLFYALWGLNYSRKGIAQQLGLKMTSYSTAELDTLTKVLESRLNQYAAIVTPAARDQYYVKKNLFREAEAAYTVAHHYYRFLDYSPRSIKPSVFSYAGNILGFEGYYNPFSGESQVNTTIPVFEQPFVACHEIGHQVGYGKENEANFSGFLACRLHPSAVFRYSVYFDMYTYAINELAMADSVRARQYISSIHPQVKKDYDELRRFLRKYKNPIEPVITWMYGKYLEANNQPGGKRTYSEVIAFLIAYQRKYGVNSL